MKAISTLHLLTLAACFVVQSGGLELSGLPGVRRALQTMETRTEPQSSQRIEQGLPRPPQPATYTVIWPAIILELIDYDRTFHIACAIRLIMTSPRRAMGTPCA
ncbi:hypothetical protein ABID19_003416 [Mesorhizobium robiniae]|uniref:Uncharacterized protein n=1 Tax=Mesorhizobium robiniae TaxID=559315 RepID=A0ABV2GQ18_9HYPH